MISVVKIWVLLNLTLFALAVSVRAAPFAVTDEEQKTIAVICRIAAKSPTINDEDTAGIAQFCVAWKAKIQQASEIKPEAKPE